MHYITTTLKTIGLILLTLYGLIMFFVAPILAPIAVHFARQVLDTNVHNGQPLITRYRLPWYFRFLETPDEMLPGDISIKSMKRTYEREGWKAAAIQWLGYRNVAHWLPWQFGKPAPDYLPNISQADRDRLGIDQKEFTLWSRSRFLWGARMLIGHAVYRDWYSTKTDNGFWAVPRITLRFIK